MSEIGNLILSVEQKQVSSQQTIQIVEILQMNEMQLERYLSDYLLENPLVDPDASYQSDCEPLHLTFSVSDDEDVLPHRTTPDVSAPAENLFTQQAFSLSQQLYLQLLPYIASETDKRILRCLVESLDSRGYLPDAPKDYCQQFGLDAAQWERYLSILHQLEPAGLGASCLQECLLLQLNRLQAPEKELAVTIVSQHLDELSAIGPRRLAKQLKVTERAVLQALALIQTLNPKPGNGLDSSEKVAYIRPDILVERGRDGFQIHLRQHSIHRLVANTSYLALASSAPADVRAYIREKKQGLDWINRCLEQRESTLLRLAQELVTRQQAFFLHGPAYLRPMDQAELSESMGVNVSTISRAVRDKYLGCCWGTFPLKAFFPRAVQNDGTVTVDRVKKQLQLLIEAEDKCHPLSDQKLCDLLNRKGIQLSRRVIAKYRSEMNIPATSQRRKSSSE